MRGAEEGVGAATDRVGGAHADDEMGRLLARATADRSAFEAVYRRYVGNVTRFAVSRCRSAADVADVVAQTFVRLLRVADRYDPERGAPLAFVIGIAANAVRDHYRAAARHQALVHRLTGRDLLDEDETERIEAALDAARAEPAVRRALASLPDAEGEMLGLVAAGASPSEAAAALGIPPNTARGRLFRARRRVRSRLAVDVEEV